jgi:hypothetical protein
MTSDFSLPFDLLPRTSLTLLLFFFFFFFLPLCLPDSPVQDPRSLHHLNDLPTPTTRHLLVFPRSLIIHHSLFNFFLPKLPHANLHPFQTLPPFFWFYFPLLGSGSAQTRHRHFSRKLSRWIFMCCFKTVAAIQQVFTIPVYPSTIGLLLLVQHEKPADRMII